MQTEGPEVAITVRTFVDRYDELVAADQKYGAEGPKAQQLLNNRGVTAAVVAEAKAMLDALTHVAQPAEPASAEAEAAQLEEAEAAMWAWYLEWSKVARVAIKQRLLLKELGFLTSRRGATDEEEEVDITTPTLPTTPTTSPIAPPATTPATATPAAASIAAH